MSPQRPNLILSSHIPNIELDILVCNRLDIESDSRNGSDILVQAQSVQNRRLSRGIETQHQQSHLLRSEDLAHHLGELGAHLDGCAGEAGRVSGSCRRARLSIYFGEDKMRNWWDARLSWYELCAKPFCGVVPCLIRREVV